METAAGGTRRRLGVWLVDPSDRFACRQDIPGLIFQLRRICHTSRPALGDVAGGVSSRLSFRILLLSSHSAAVCVSSVRPLDLHRLREYLPAKRSLRRGLLLLQYYQKNAPRLPMSSPFLFFLSSSGFLLLYLALGCIGHLR